MDYKDIKIDVNNKYCNISIFSLNALKLIKQFKEIRAFRSFHKSKFIGLGDIISNGAKDSDEKYYVIFNIEEKESLPFKCGHNNVYKKEIFDINIGDKLYFSKNKSEVYINCIIEDMYPDYLSTIRDQKINQLLDGL
jgi:hypothetical protein